MDPIKLTGTAYPVSAPRTQTTETKAILRFDGTRYQLIENGVEQGVMHGQGKIASVTDGKTKTYDGFFDNGIITGKGTITFLSGDMYEGEVAQASKGNGYPQGKGTYTYVDPKSRLESYTGSFDNNKFNGNGTLIWRNGNTYTGDFKVHKRTGQGEEFIQETGERFKGEFREGKRVNGEITYADGSKTPFAVSASHFSLKVPFTPDHIAVIHNVVFENKNSYVGECLDGKKHGQGEYVTHSGDRYKGSYSHGDMEGWGKLTESGGTIREGNWKKNQLHGEGKKIWPNGDFYTGDFVNGERTGKGTYVWGEGPYKGQMYTGDYVKNQQTGTGVLTWPGEFTYTGQFLDDEFHGPGTLAFPNGSTITGRFDMDELTFGQLTYKNGQVYIGSFANQLPHGQGAQTYTDGRIFKGHFKDGLPDNGAMTFPDGQIFNGQFKNGMPDNGTKELPGILKWTGQFQNYELTVGTIEYPDGRKITAQFRKGIVPYGEATVVQANGQTSKIVYPPSR